jgi:hypothetical protein
MLYPKHLNLTHQDLNTTIDKPDNQWNIHLESCNTLPFTAKPSSNGQLTQC